MLLWLGEAFEDFSYELLDAFADGDRVALCLATRGTHTDELLGKLATGRLFEIESTSTGVEHIPKRLTNRLTRPANPGSPNVTQESRQACKSIAR